MSYETGKNQALKGRYHTAGGRVSLANAAPGLEGWIIPPRGGKFVEGNAMIRGVVDEC